MGESRQSGSPISTFAHQPQAQMSRWQTHRTGATGGVALEIGQYRWVASSGDANVAEVATTARKAGVGPLPDIPTGILQTVLIAPIAAEGLERFRQALAVGTLRILGEPAACRVAWIFCHRRFVNVGRGSRQYPFAMPWQPIVMSAPAREPGRIGAGILPTQSHRRQMCRNLIRCLQCRA